MSAVEIKFIYLPVSNESIWLVCEIMWVGTVIKKFVSNYIQSFYTFVFEICDDYYDETNNWDDYINIWAKWYDTVVITN